MKHQNGYKNELCRYGHSWTVRLRKNCFEWICKRCNENSVQSFPFSKSKEMA